jgi:hypothetical protein
MSSYLNFNMDSEQSKDCIRLVLRAMSELRTATYADIQGFTGLGMGAVKRYVTHLCELSVLERLTARPPSTVTAKFAIGPTAYGDDPGMIVRRLVGANDWPRDEFHVRRTGLVAYLFPFAASEG